MFNQKEKKIMNTNFDTYVRFHIGSGYKYGFYQKSGCLHFCEEDCDFQKLLGICSDNLFEHNRDKKGRFCPKYLSDCNGNTMVEHEDLDKKTGSLNWDEWYDYDYCCLLSECSEDELYCIFKDTRAYKSRQLKEYVKNWAKENGLDEEEI